MSSRTVQSVSSVIMWPTRHLEWRRTWRPRPICIRRRHHRHRPTFLLPACDCDVHHRRVLAGSPCDVDLFPQPAPVSSTGQAQSRITPLAARAARTPRGRAGSPGRRPAMGYWSSLVSRPPTPTSRRSIVRAPCPPHAVPLRPASSNAASPSVPFASMAGHMQDGRKGSPWDGRIPGADGICLFEMPTGWTPGY